jgi:hypothetical protein
MRSPSPLIAHTASTSGPIDTVVPVARSRTKVRSFGPRGPVTARSGEVDENTTLLPSAEIPMALLLGAAGDPSLRTSITVEVPVVASYTRACPPLP